MTVFRRRPEWTVTIRRPLYSATTETNLLYTSVNEWSAIGSPVTSVQFVSNQDKANGVNIYTSLREYSYENDISSPQGTFSIKLTPEQDGNGLSWKDKIQSRDIVFISEFGEIRYIGVVTGTNYSMSMQGGKPNRSVSINGMSIGGILQTFNIPMNLYLWYNLGVDPELQNDKLLGALNSKLNQNQSLSSIFSSINDTFFSVNFGLH